MALESLDTIISKLCQVVSVLSIKNNYLLKLAKQQDLVKSFLHNN